MVLLRIRRWGAPVRPRSDATVSDQRVLDSDPERGVVRVLHVFGRLDRGGAELRTLDVLRATVHEPVHHEFICLSGLPGEIDDDFLALGAVIHYIALGPRFPYRLVRLLRTRQIGILHSHVHLFSGGLVALAAVAGVPCRIVHFRSTHDGHPCTVTRRMFRSFQRELIQRFATRILAVSTGAMEAWSTNWQTDPRCRVVLNGLDTSVYAAAIRNPITRVELGIGEDGPIFAFIGRFEPVKRPELALRAFAAMNLSSWLICAGSVTRENRTSFESLANTVGVGDRVVLLGLRDDVARILALADVVVMTSSFEGLPGVVLEALAAGARVVASRLPGTTEIAEYINGVTLVEPGACPDTWATRMADTAKDVDRHARSWSARMELHDAFCRSPFSVEKTARELTGIWLSA